MARYLGPRAKVSRRTHKDLEPFSGAKSIESKCKFETMPGKAPKARTRTSDYGNQLQAKQELREYYGLMEKQFKRYVTVLSKKANKRLGLSSSDNLLVLLESRLDNVVYRMGFACTRREARQLIAHNHILVNGIRVNRPSYRCAPGDVVKIVEKAKKHLRISSSLELADQKTECEWVDVKKDKLEGVFSSYPDVNFLNEMFQVHLIIEHYSK